MATPKTPRKRAQKPGEPAKGTEKPPIKQTDPGAEGATEPRVPAATAGPAAGSKEPAPKPLATEPPAPELPVVGRTGQARSGTRADAAPAGAPDTAGPDMTKPAAAGQTRPETLAAALSDRKTQTRHEAAGGESEASAPKADTPEVTPPRPDRQAPVAPPPAPAVRSGPGLGALLAGGIAAAVIGFVMARYVLPEGWPVPGASPLQDQITAQATEIAALKARLAAVAASDDAGTGAALANLQQQVAQASTAAEAAQQSVTALIANPPGPPEMVVAQLATLSERLAVVEQRPLPDGSGATPEAVAQLEAAVAALRQDLTSQEARAAAAAAAVRAEAEEIKAEAEAERAEGTARADATLRAAALTQIAAAYQSGAPFADALAVLGPGPEALPAALTENAATGITTMAVLIADFDTPARAAIADELRADMGGNLTDRLGAFLRTQTGARSMSPQQGADADAVLSRAEAALRADDLDGALAELEALSAPALAAMAGWVERARIRQAAGQAIAGLPASLGER